MKLVPTTIILLTISSNLAAKDLNIVGTISHILKPPPVVVRASQSRSAAPVTPSQSRPREIKFMNIQLSDNAKSILALKAQQPHEPLMMSGSSLKKSGKVELGMSNVPVLNQGIHGSCVTFATTAAIDAVLEKGDYVSQLCQLQLGNYLAANGYSESGWDGSFASTVLSQMDSFGFMTKAQEAAHGCGGLTEYPLMGEDPESSMNIEEFHQFSTPLKSSSDNEGYRPAIEWSTILNVSESFADRVDTNKTLADVKKALNAGDRVTFGTLLLDLDLGTAGAVGRNKVANDTWVLTPEIARDVYSRPFFAGHEMVITGYDDNAVAKDDNGYEYRGLLTLRNSWGADIGDHGNFYMTYDYFKLLVIEAHRIRE